MESIAPTAGSAGGPFKAGFGLSDGSGGVAVEQLPALCVAGDGRGGDRVGMGGAGSGVGRSRAADISSGEINGLRELRRVVEGERAIPG